MFGFLKEKELDEGLLVENLAQVTLDCWLDEGSIDLSKFVKIGFFQRQMADDKFAQRFTKEKLRVVAALSLITLTQSVNRENLVSDFLNRVKSEVDKLEDPNIKHVSLGLVVKAKEYASIWESNNLKEASDLLMDKFSKEAFGSSPPKSNVDAQYLLYKQLSGLQRTVILKGRAAERISRG